MRKSGTLRSGTGQLGSVRGLNQTTGITLKGLEYPLVNATIEMGSSLGVSNSFKGATASVSIENGVLIVTKSTD